MSGQKSDRRTFLRLLSAALPATARSARAAEARIEVLPKETIGRISPEIYGQFTEHIGGVIHDGIWVGEDSKIPNEGGIRKQLLDHLRTLKPPVIRWPGGCFADSYNWRDGIGPRAGRPRRANFWINDMEKAPDGPQKYEPNQFGTHEFMRFARLSGAEPYLAANLRSLPPQDFLEWIDYCNAPAGTTTLSDLRASNGDREPFRVRYWGVGNESWGCGGDFAADEYAVEFRRYTSFIPGFGAPLRLIGSGPNGGDLNWTRRFFSKLVENGKGVLGRLHGWALHYYCGSVGKRQAIDFDQTDWYELLARAEAMDGLINGHWDAMAEIDREHRIKLVVDEWGAWHDAGSEVHPAYLFGQTPTLRDALVSAITLDIFNRRADRVAMANVAQLVNNLHALFLAREDRFTVTPNYHIFRMYSAHAGADSVRAEFSAPAIAYKRTATRWLTGLSGSASVRGDELVLTVANRHASEERTAELVVRDARIASCEATVLTGPALNAHNSFAEPRAVQPATQTIDVTGGVVRLRPASVTRFVLRLA
jgi:alpha-N-arabinofuranosidase